MLPVTTNYIYMLPKKEQR